MPLNPLALRLPNVDLSRALDGVLNRTRIVGLATSTGRDWRQTLLLMASGASAVDDADAPAATTDTPSGTKDSASSAGHIDADPDPVAKKPKFDPAPDIDMADLVREHSDAVYRVALSVTRNPSLAEDVSQDALIKAWQALPSYRGEAPLRNWILRITHNTAVSTLRKRREEIRDPAELPERLNHRTTESEVHNRLAMERFSLALNDLDETSRSIVVLREVEGLSYDEICEVLSLSLPTVKTRLLRARRQLARALEGWKP